MVFPWTNHNREGKPTAMKAQRSVEIQTPVETAFEYVDDAEKLKLWMDGLEETEYTSPVDRENPVGAAFIQKIREGGRLQTYEGKITAYEKPTHLGVEVGNRHFAAKVDYRFESLNGSTRLDYQLEMIMHNWFARLMGRLFGWMTCRILDKQLAKLKQAAEEGW